MNPRVFKIDQVRPYSLEIYGPRSAGELIWRIESETPLPVPDRGERIQPIDARGARPELFHEIIEIELVIWENGGRACSVTRVFTQPAQDDDIARRLRPRP